MSVTVTIHKGELAQIKRHIENKEYRGQLYGLWTHSFQPVIQYVIGGPKGGDEKDEKKIKEYLMDNHFLQHVGDWSADDKGGNDFKENPCGPFFVKMTVEVVNKNTINVKPHIYDKSSSYEKKLDGMIEELEGDSAFRLIKDGPFESGKTPFTRYHCEKVPGANDLRVIKQSPKAAANEAETKDTQWYSADEGMKLFGMIHGAFQNQFEITGTSRNTETHDISMSIKFNQREYSVDFPSNFPVSKAVLDDGRNKRVISLSKTATKKQGKSQERDPKQQENKGKKSKKNKESTEKSTVKKSSVGPEEKNNDTKDDEGAAAQDESEPELSSDKVPELLVKGILGILQGTRV